MSLRTIMMVAVTVLVTACGFHLRGNLPLSETMMIVAVRGEDPDVKRELTKALTNSGAQVVEDEEAARSVIDLFDVTFERVVSTIDTRGKVTAYNLIYKVRYRVLSNEGDELKKANFRLNRDYNFDPDFILQAEREEEALREAMVEDVARRIMYQLATVADAGPLLWRWVPA